jgi:hypothetical protein
MDVNSLATAQLLEIDCFVPQVKREQELNEKLTKRLAEDGNGSIVSQVTVLLLTLAGISVRYRILCKVVKLRYEFFMNPKYFFLRRKLAL